MFSNVYSLLIPSLNRPPVEHVVRHEPLRLVARQQEQRQLAPGGLCGRRKPGSPHRLDWSPLLAGLLLGDLLEGCLGPHSRKSKLMNMYG